MRDNFRIADMQYPQSGMYTLQYVAPQLVDTIESVAYTEGEMMTINYGNYTVEQKVVKFGNQTLRQIKKLKDLDVGKIVKNIRGTLQTQGLSTISSRDLSKVQEVLVFMMDCLKNTSVDLAVVMVQDPSLPVLDAASKIVVSIFQQAFSQQWAKDMVRTAHVTHPNDGRFLIYQLLTYSMQSPAAYMTYISDKLASYYFGNKDPTHQLASIMETLDSFRMAHIPMGTTISAYHLCNMFVNKFDPVCYNELQFKG